MLTSFIVYMFITLEKSQWMPKRYDNNNNNYYYFLHLEVVLCFFIIIIFFVVVVVVFFSVRYCIVKPNFYIY